MPIVAVAVCPPPPLLVPAVARGAAGELDGLRGACARALAGFTDARADLVVVLGTGPRTEAYHPGDSGSFAEFGVDLAVTLGPRVCSGAPVLPPSLTVGAWLLAQSGWSADRQGFALAPGDDPRPAAHDLRQLPGRVALLALADGSACRTARAPGAYDPRAEGFDGALAEALGAGDPAGLQVDAALAEQVWCRTWPAWHLLAAATAGSTWAGSLLFHEAPYGVGYLVGAWRPT